MNPFSIEAEQAILSNLLNSRNGECIDQCSLLSSNHFYNRSHQIVFETISKLHGELKPFDLVTVTNRLRDQSKLEEVGGIGELSKLAMASRLSIHLSDHVAIVEEKFKARRIEEICEGSKISLNSGNEVADVLSKLESDIFELNVSSNQEENELQGGSDDLQRMIDVRKNGGEVTGLLSGIKAWDDCHFGFQRSQYYVLAGRPSAGKSAFADQVALNLILRNVPFLYVALESSRERVLAKIACKMAKVNYYHFIINNLDIEKLNQVQICADRIKKSSMILIRPMDINPNGFRSIMRRAKRRFNIELVILDYLQKVSIPSGMEIRQAISTASMNIQRGCVETNVPALVLCQLNREAEKEARPRMGHLKESGQIEQDADNISILWAQKEKRDLPQGERMLPVACSIEKNKDGASGHDIEFNFEMEKMIFHSYSMI